MNKRACLFVAVAVLVTIMWSSCSDRNGPLAVFKKLSPHDQYGQRLRAAGLDKTAMGNAWLLKADESLGKAPGITIPYKETGYFSADRITLAAYRFTVKRGEKIHLSITRRPAADFRIFIDLLQAIDGQSPKVVASADTNGIGLSYEAKKTGEYILRLQPELLRGGEYTFSITKGPSLGFPVAMSGKPHIGSFWGDSRDEGGRRHEGIDIFAPKGTPAIATNNGSVTRVTENKLGGKVVLMHPDDEDYELYYAHLGAQLVHEGQIVHAGDTVGLIDNTGNAKYTPSHLHFGIYTSGGAVDPLPFVDREIHSPAEITAPANTLNALVKTRIKCTLYADANAKTVALTLPANTPLTIVAAERNDYRAILPDGREGYINSNDVTSITNMRSVTLTAPLPVYDAADTTAARKLFLKSGDSLIVMAIYKDFWFVSYTGTTGWVRADK